MTGNNHIVYLNLRADTGVAYYIGAGKRQRAELNRCMETKSRKTAHEAHGTVVKVIADGLSKMDAHDFEELLIKEHRRVGISLVNKSSGGVYPANGIVRNHSDSTRKKLSTARKLRVTKQSTRDKMSISALGNTRAKGHTHSAEYCAVLSARMKGNSNGLGYVHTPEARQKISLQRKGIPKSPETRDRMRVAQQLRFNKNTINH